MKKVKYSGKYYGAKMLGWLYLATCPCCKSISKNTFEDRGRKKRARREIKLEIERVLKDE